MKKVRTKRNFAERLSEVFFMLLVLTNQSNVLRVTNATSSYVKGCSETKKSYVTQE